MASRNCLFLLALALVALNPIVIYTQQVTHLYFDVAKGDIFDLYDMLKVALSNDQPQVLGFEGHLVLAPERQDKTSRPNHMIHLHLTGEYNDETTIFIAADDLSVYGFANKSGDKYILDGLPNFFPNEHVLNFGNDYSKLIRGGVTKLPTVPLGRKSLLHGVHALSWHDPQVGDISIVEKQAKLGVCRVVLMVSESLRLTPIRNSFAPFFDLESFASEEDCNLVNYRGPIPIALLKWKTCNCWDRMDKDVQELEKVQIYDAGTALQKVDIISLSF